jgi:4-alpha-glucanotransferase
MTLNPAQPLAGILEPVFAIRTEDDLGIGDTAGVRQMIDWCHRHGLNIFQTLPINETSDDNSPYNAISSLAIEPATLAISPEHVPDLGASEFEAIAKPRMLAELREGRVNYPTVRTLKRKLLDAAFANFLTHHFNRETNRALEFRAFLMDSAEWLSDYALFRVLMEENGNLPTWESWHAEHRGPRRARTWLLSLPEARRDELMRKQLFFAYVQWIAFTQWQALKAYATEQNVFLMGDIPFGVGRHSADVWASRSFFDLDWSGGAPPEWTFKGDPFTEKWGQNWGVPNYRWEELRRHNFEWWHTRIATLRKMFHLYRCDPVRGCFRIYTFPWPPERNAEFLPLTEPQAAAKTGGRLPGFKLFPDDTPEHKVANQAQGEEILRVVLAASGDTAVVAEDLGCVPEYVPPTLQKLRIPGFRIPMFFREQDGAYSDPRRYPRLSLAQPATHDHAPLAAMWAAFWENIDAGKNVEHNQRELRHLANFAGLQGEEPPREFSYRLHEGISRVVLDSNSWLAIFQITDVFAQTERFNTPGTISATNWSHRLAQTVKQLDEEPQLLAKAKIFSRLAQKSGRAIQ